MLGTCLILQNFLVGSKKQIYHIRVDSEINIEAQSHVSLQVFIPNTKIFTSFLKILKESPSVLIHIAFSG